MNIDDPKLTAFALDELDEPERSTIAREIAQSPNAQRVVDETRELARTLKSEFAAELNEKTKPPVNLSDIRDDPWIWSIGRPLSIAAAVAIFALLGAILVGTYSRHDSVRTAPTDYVVEAEQNPPNQPGELPAPDQIPNPLRADSIRQVQRVVIGEIDVDSHVQNAELRLIETINDVYRVERLKQRLSIPAVSKKFYRGLANHTYGLIFLDRDNRVVASAQFYRSTDSEVVLQPMKNAYERGGRYFMNGGALLPGDWRAAVDYNQYVIPFPDWSESIGYQPGA
jgi:hypothetical protein